MATAKIILYKSKKKADGRYPIALRVTQDRKAKYSYIDWIDEDEWDEEKSEVKKSHLNSKRLNHAITARKKAIGDLILEDDANGSERSSAQLIEIVNGKSKRGAFFPFAQEYLDHLEKTKRYTVESADKARIEVLKLHVKNKGLRFQEIDRRFLEGLKAFLIAERGVSQRTVMNYYVLIRTLFNRAIDSKLVDMRYYPFGRGGVRIKFPDTIKIGLDKEEIIAIRELKLKKGSPVWHVRNQFLFSFYQAGIRVSDVLRMKWQDIQDDRLYYKMGKNDKADSLKLTERANAILKQYKRGSQKNEGYIFPELERAKEGDEKDLHRKIRTATKKYNVQLKKIADMAEIDKPVTTHIARHSFGHIAAGEISTKALQKLYRHSSSTTTEGYQKNFIHKDVDEALEATLDF